MAGGLVAAGAFMIYDHFGSLRVTSSQDRLVLEEAGLFRAGLAPLLFRIPAGVVLIAAGCLVTFGLLDIMLGGGVRGAFGWLLIAVFLTSLGVVPVFWGLSMLGRHWQFVFDGRDRSLVASVRYFGLLCYRRRHAFDDFDRVEVEAQLRGPIAKNWLHAVTCRGPKAERAVVACEDASRALALAEQIAERTGLPVTHPFVLAL